MNAQILTVDPNELGSKVMDLLSMAELLKLTRLNRDVTQEDLAEELGVHKNTVANWERGVNGVPAYRLRQLEQVYGLPEGYFDDYSDPVSKVVEMADDIAEIKASLTKLQQDVHTLLNLTKPKKRSA